MSRKNFAGVVRKIAAGSKKDTGARGLPVVEKIVDRIVQKTKNASAAFIKELMRRSAQFYIEQGSQGALTEENLTMALEEMLFCGGSLNVKLLGGDLSTQSQN
jgi:hypothetical protein